jgi:predicted DNA binding protein
VTLTDRQYEVIEYVLAAGYFEWACVVTADELEISRATLLVHLRKDQSKLLADALESATAGFDRLRLPESSTPPK